MEGGSVPISSGSLLPFPRQTTANGKKRRFSGVLPSSFPSLRIPKLIVATLSVSSLPVPSLSVSKLIISTKLLLMVVMMVLVLVLVMVVVASSAQHVLGFAPQVGPRRRTCKLPDQSFAIRLCQFVAPEGPSGVPEPVVRHWMEWKTRIGKDAGKGKLLTSKSRERNGRGVKRGSVVRVRKESPARKRYHVPASMAAGRGVRRSAALGRWIHPSSSSSSGSGEPSTGFW